MKTSLRNELLKASQNGYAIPAFNWDNFEMLKSIIVAAEELNSPIIAMITESSANHLEIDSAFALGKQAVLKAKVPVILHLDHGFNFDIIKKAIDFGFDSVMIDASMYSFEENVKLTKQVVTYAHLHGVEVESEIGHVGGKEDDTNSEKNYFTDIKQAIDFVELTKVDALAIAVGTTHGIFKQKPNLQHKLINKLKEKIQVPLVLHGSSGLENEQLILAIKNGISKINIGTDLKLTYFEALRKFLNENPQSYDCRKLGKYLINQMKSFVKERIVLLNSQNKI